MELTNEWGLMKLADLDGRSMELAGMNEGLLELMLMFSYSSFPWAKLHLVFFFTTLYIAHRSLRH